MKRGSGWRGESHRHRLAGMGIKTSNGVWAIKDFNMEQHMIEYNKYWRNQSNTLPEYIISDDELIKILSKVFKQFRNKKVTEKDIIFEISLGYRWVTPREASILVNTAEERGLITLDSEKLKGIKGQSVATVEFDYKNIETEGFIARIQEDATIQLEASGQLFRFNELEPHIQRLVLRYDTLENIRRNEPLFFESGTEVY